MYCRQFIDFYKLFYYLGFIEWEEIRDNYRSLNDIAQSHRFNHWMSPGNEKDFAWFGGHVTRCDHCRVVGQN